MRQVVLGVTQYETSLRQYPMNWGQVSTVGTPTTGTNTNANGLSWITAILPNLDLAPLFSQTSLSQPGLGSGVTNFYTLGYSNASYGISNPTVLATPIGTLKCPSDGRGNCGNQMLVSPGSSPTALTYAVTNYKACEGSNWVGSSSYGIAASSGTIGRNNGNSDGIDHSNGVMCRGGATTAGGAPVLTANMDIRDGASKTIFLGECVPEYCGWSLWYWFDGTTATCGIPLNYVPTSGTTVNLDTLASTWQFSFGYRSRHPGGANFVACDNSGHYIPNTIDFNVYKAMATIDGNEATVIGTTGTAQTVDWP